MPIPDFSTFLLPLGGIILIDLILSGDNALVIGAVAARVSRRRQRWIALIFGGVCAIVTRIVLTAGTTFLLSIPYLQAIGGLVVLYIAINLLSDNQPAPGTDKASVEHTAATEDRSGEGLSVLPGFLSRWVSRRTRWKNEQGNWSLPLAIVTIAIADISMSTDNIVAIGALAHKRINILIIGLSFSIFVLLVGSALVSELVNRIPGLTFLTSVILSLISSYLIWNDFHNFVNDSPFFHYGLYALCIVVLLLAVFIIRMMTRRRTRAHANQMDQTASPEPAVLPHNHHGSADS
jgi:YjbE family integral membrane protein